MSPVAFDEALHALDVYRTVTEFVDQLQPDDLLVPTRCRGWMIGDLLFHMTTDAQRALVTFATPANSASDVDFATYWLPWRPGTEAAASHARWVRVSAAALSPLGTKELWLTTAPAALRAASRVDPTQPLATQGHVLAPADFLATLAVEATIHYLDLTLHFPGATDPPGPSLELVLRTLDGCLGEPVRAAWDVPTYALKATGRTPLDEGEVAVLGGQAERFPLFG